MMIYNRIENGRNKNKPLFPAKSEYKVFNM